MDEAREVHARARLDAIEHDARQRELARRVAAALYSATLGDIVRRSRKAIGRGSDAARMGEASSVLAYRFWIANGRTWDLTRSITSVHEAARAFEAAGMYRTGD